MNGLGRRLCFVIEVLSYLYFSPFDLWFSDFRLFQYSRMPLNISSVCPWLFIIFIMLFSCRLKQDYLLQLSRYAVEQRSIDNMMVHCCYYIRDQSPLLELVLYVIYY